MTILQEIFVGLPKTVGDKNAKDPMDREWTSGIFKQPVDGPVWLGKTNIEGDGQADLKHHGGVEKAVFAYPRDHYTYWQQELAPVKIGPAGMGENFSFEGQLEADVAIGDTYEVGDAIIQVSQPRQPCWKPARRFRVKKLALLLQNTGKTGWYYRVLQEGHIEKGNTITLVDRPAPKWTIERCNEIMHIEKDNIKEAKELAELKWLAVNWKRTFTNRVEKGINPNINRRVIGPNE